MKHIYLITLVIASFIANIPGAQAQCTAGFTYTASGTALSFTDTSADSTGVIMGWNWDFGDGNGSNEQNPVHIYSAAGQYAVSLSIFTTSFCFQTFTDTITVTGPCNPVFTAQVDTTTGEVFFAPQPYAQNFSFTWNFGDSSTSTDAYPVHQYQEGTYYACMTVLDSAGFCSGTYCDSVTVTIVPPTCETAFTWSDQGNGFLTFLADPLDFSMTYEWDFGDGNTGQNGFTTHTFATAGSYTVCLTTIGASCTYTFCDTVTAAADTTCDLTYAHTIDSMTVSFFANPFSFNQNVVYNWNFGDGSTTTGQNVTHTYATAGTYNACVKMVDSFNGCDRVYCDTIMIASASSIKEVSKAPALTVFPNPVTNTAFLELSIYRREKVTIEVFDILGNRIEVLKESELDKGDHRIEWNAEGLSKGAYLVKIATPSGIASRLLIRN